MADVLSRRNALLGWFVWRLAKRRLRQKLRPDGSAPRRHRILRVVGAVAVLATLARALTKRGDDAGDATG